MRKAKKPHRSRDPHCKAIYDLERDFHDFNRETLTLAETRQWVRRACWHFKLKPPPVRQHDNRGPTFTFSDGSLICFKRKHKNPAIALHEAAHYITDRVYGQLRQDHGPSWLGVYGWLLVALRVVPGEALRAELRKRKLRLRKVCRDRLRKY